MASTDYPQTFSANSLGASPGATATTNRTAFQAAMDAAAAVGGGRVTATPGTYTVDGLVQDSRVELDLPNVTLRSPGNGSTAAILTSKLRTTVGSITAGSPTLTVSSATGIDVGCLVGVRAAGDTLNTQYSTLTADITDVQVDAITLTDGTGFIAPGWLVCESEIIAYLGISAGVLTGVTRGAFGTTAAAHTATTKISLAKRHIARVTNVTGTTITLDANAVRTVASAQVTTGIVAPVIHGARFDGVQRAGSALGCTAINWSLVSQGIADQFSLVNTDQGVLLNNGTRGCFISEFKSRNVGRPDLSTGSVVWMFQSCSQNTISDFKMRGDMYGGVYLDDRSTNADEYSGTSNNNTVEDFLIDNNKATAPAIDITGSSGNRVRNGTVIGCSVGVNIYSGLAQSHTSDGAIPDANSNEIAGMLIGSATPWTLTAPGNILRNCRILPTATNSGTNVGGNVIVDTLTAGTFNPVPKVTAFSGLKAALSSTWNPVSTALQVLGDSTGNDGDEWVYLLAQQVATDHPDWTVVYKLFDDATQNYALPITFQTGTAGLRYLDTSTGAKTRRLPVGDSTSSPAPASNNLDVRINLSKTWTDGVVSTFCGKNSSVDTHRGWYFGVSATGYLTFASSSDGLSGTTSTKFSTANVTGFATGSAHWLRVVYIADNGASGYDVKFYTSTDGIAWTQLGTTVTTATARTIFNSDFGYEIGGTGGVTSAGMKIYEIQIRDGVDGPLLAPALPDLYPAWDTTGSEALVVGAPQFTVLNGSVAGKNIAYLGDATRLPKLCQDFGQSVVCLSTSHNEGTAVGIGWGNTYTTFLNSVLTQLRRPVAPVLFTQNPERTGNVGKYAHARRRVDLITLARKLGRDVIDLYPAFLSRPDWQTALMYDDTHPGPAGSALWRDTVLAAYYAA